ncbi:hypothetical protein ABIE91_001301 [Bradyrhizobium elkanii]
MTALICVRTSIYLRNLAAVALLPLSRTRSGAILQPLDSSTSVFDLEKSQHDIDQRDEPETQRGVDAAGEVLRGAQQPADIKMLRPKAGEGDAMAVEPDHRGIVEGLIPRRIRNQ